jgi:AP-4 complex subunit sigma-1
MPIQFILLVNKQGQTRLAQYTNYKTIKERVTLEGELVRKCLSRNENQCSFLEHRQYKVIYRRYASLYFIIGLDIDDECVTYPLTLERTSLLGIDTQPRRDT